MLRRFSINYVIFSITLDWVLIAICLAVAVLFRPALSQLPIAKFIPAPIPIPWFLYIIFPTLWVSNMLLLFVYDGRKNLRAADEFSALFTSTMIAAVSMAGTLYLSYREISRLLFITFVLMAFLAMLFWRLVARALIRNYQRDPAQRRQILIVGTGTLGQQIGERILQEPDRGLNIVGYIDTEDHLAPSQAPYIGGIPEAIDQIERFSVDDVIIALPRSEHEQINLLVAELHKLPVRVWLIPDYFQLALHKAVIEDFAGIPMLDLRAPTLSESQRLVKRIFDLVVGVAILPFSLILMAFIAITIRIEGPGRIILHQKRAGENGKEFHMLKFRSMVPNADELHHLVSTTDEEGHIIHKIPNDPRVTRVGRFLRRTSLDELPQLWNVLLGQMSLVGPRPELPELVALYEPWQWKRFTVPQGITGWWQVHGRSDKPMHLHTEDDLYYVQNYSLLLDLKILWLTAGTVIRGKGAF